MREFKFDPATGRAMLNGKPYFMRGSNITLYRFFEDSECGNLPWDEKWVRLLHQRVKDMHWNCLRYCIGFPPEAWYDIADEAGILIQDEFPIWFGGPGWSTWPKELKSDELAVRIRASGCASAGTTPASSSGTRATKRPADQTGPRHPAGAGAGSLRPAVGQQLHLAAGSRATCFESHPYHFQDANFKLANLATRRSGPAGQRHPQRRQARGHHQRIRLALGQS